MNRYERETNDPDGILAIIVAMFCAGGTLAFVLWLVVSLAIHASG